MCAGFVELPVSGRIEPSRGYTKQQGGLQGRRIISHHLELSLSKPRNTQARYEVETEKRLSVALARESKVPKKETKCNTTVNVF